MEKFYNVFKIIYFTWSGTTSPQYTINVNAATPINNGQPHPFTNGAFSPQAEPVDFSGLPRPIGMEYVNSMGSSNYSRESTPSNGSSHFMEGYRDFNGNSPHASYAMFSQSEYPPNGYTGYNSAAAAAAAYHYSNPYINPTTNANGYPMSSEYPNGNTVSPFVGMPPPPSHPHSHLSHHHHHQHLSGDLKLSKERLVILVK